MMIFATLRRMPLAVGLTGLLCGAALLTAGCNFEAQTEPEKSPVTVATKATPNPAATPTAAGSGVELSAQVLAAPIKMLDGQTLKLSDYKGKVVIINYWATWCGPCRQEMPELVAMRQSLKDKGLEIISVTHIQNDPDPEAVKDFVKQFKIPYPVGYAEGNLILGLQVPQAGGQQNSIPQSFIISREGRLLKRFTGYAPTYPAAMRAVVEQALNAAAPAAS